MRLRLPVAGGARPDLNYAGKTAHRSAIGLHVIYLSSLVEIDPTGAGVSLAPRATFSVMSGKLAKKLGKRVALLRKLANTSQAVLAERVGTAVQVISRIERGEDLPSLARLEEVAHALGVEMRELFVFEEPHRGPIDAAVERVAALLRLHPVDRIELVRRIAVEVLSSR